MTDVAELTGMVAVEVAGESIEVPRPPFRRLKPLLPLVAGLDADDDGKAELDLSALVEVGEVLGQILFGENADTYLDRLYTPTQFTAFLSSAMAALQLGEAGASTGT